MEVSPARAADSDDDHIESDASADTDSDGAEGSAPLRMENFGDALAEDNANGSPEASNSSSDDDDGEFTTGNDHNFDTETADYVLDNDEDDKHEEVATKAKKQGGDDQSSSWDTGSGQDTGEDDGGRSIVSDTSASDDSKNETGVTSSSEGDAEDCTTYISNQPSLTTLNKLN